MIYMVYQISILGYFELIILFFGYFYAFGINSRIIMGRQLVIAVCP